MFVMLLGSVTYAQDFDFYCETPPPTEPTLREKREKIVTDFNNQDGVSDVVITYQNASYIIVAYSVNEATSKSFYWSSTDNHDSNQSVQNSGHFGDQSQAAFDATLIEFKLRLKEANFELALFGFYNGPEADALDILNYGNQLSEVSPILATAADVAFTAGLEAQEAFILSLVQGATFQGQDSQIFWDATDNYYQIVTSNVGEGNGYFNIYLDDNHQYLPNANPGTVLGPENFRHLAYHVMANLWHLADITDAELRDFRQTWLKNYAENRGKGYEKSTFGDTEVYRVFTNVLNKDGIDRNCIDYGADRIEDLTLGQFANLVAQWKIDEANL